jgi:hypothetical protein
MHAVVKKLRARTDRASFPHLLLLIVLLVSSSSLFNKFSSEQKKNALSGVQQQQRSSGNNDYYYSEKNKQRKLRTRVLANNSRNVQESFIDTGRCNFMDSTKQFSFVHIPKCAGASWIKELQTYLSVI